MRTWMNWKGLAIVALMASLIMSVGCGKKDNPLPPPPPQIPNNGGTPLFGGGGNCGGLPAGTPFNQSNTPYYGTLSSYYGGGSYGSSSITLTLAYAQGFSGSYQTNNIVGIAQLVAPEVTYGNLCASSVDPTTGAPSYGQSQGPYISMSLSGIAQLQNPYQYGGLPGQQQPFIPAQMYVDIGVSCGAYLVDNRVQGCVDVSVGGYSYQYTAR